MKFFAFHLMPYRHLDFAKADAYRSYWVVLPNSHYDPKKGPRLYQEYIDQLVFAAKVGFDGICVNEHHQTAYGLMPGPNIIASALIDRTRGMDVKIAVIGRALPIVSNPLTIAEEFAMLDNLSDGRLVAGFVRGIGCEYHSTEVNPIYSHERFHEAHDLIVRAWTETGPFAFEGEHYNFGYVNTWPRCVQAPHPPISIPSQGSGEPSNGRRRRSANIRSSWRSVRPSGRQVPWIVSAAGREVRLRDQRRPTRLVDADLCGRDRRDRRAGVGRALGGTVQQFLPYPAGAIVSAGLHVDPFAAGHAESRKGLAAARVTFKDLMTRGNVIVGSPATVREKIEAIHAKTGFRIMVPMTQFGTLPDELVKKSTQMFAEEVAPKLRSL